MCLIIFAVEARPDLPLVIAANRDEFYARPTGPAASWHDAPDVLGGRDLKEGGSWFGISVEGRWAAVTNYREAAMPRPEAPSRGALVAEYLLGHRSPSQYLASLASEARRYNGFNLLVGDRDSVRWFSNRGAEHPLHDVDLEPGVYGLSNHLLNTPWPKVQLGRRDLEQALAGGAHPDTVLAGLLDHTLADEADLPSTGIPPEQERALSSRFIRGTEYGTRSSTVVRVGQGGQALLLERTFQPPDRIETVRLAFTLRS